MTINISHYLKFIGAKVLNLHDNTLLLKSRAIIVQIVFLMIKNKFPDNLNTAVFTTKFILENSSPVLYVYHDEEDGAWQFVGKEDCCEEDCRVISLEEMINIDPTVSELAYLPLGFFAKRKSKEDKWEVCEMIDN